MATFKSVMSSFTGNSPVKTQGMILFGLPGAGKGTYGSILAKELVLCKIAPGDLLRKNLKEEWFKSDPHYAYIKNSLANGLLVKDEIVMDLVLKEYTRQKDNYKGLMFDGIPRNLRQIDLLQGKFDLSNFLLVNVILREDILIEKLMGRRVCNSCGRNYNVCDINKEGYRMEPLLPKKQGECDDCKGQLSARQDDKEDVIRNRIEVYKKETFPVMAKLEKIVGRKVDFEPRNGVKDYPLLRKMVDGVA